MTSSSSWTLDNKGTESLIKIVGWDVNVVLRNLTKILHNTIEMSVNHFLLPIDEAQPLVTILDNGSIIA